MTRKLKLKQRNPLWNHPSLKKGGKHEKSKRKKRDLQNDEKEKYD